MTTLRDRYRGCLLGGAIGDALGAGIEFLSLAEIRRRFGPAGVTGYVPAYGRTGAITDDTQMTLFTAEGLLRDWHRPASERDTAGAVWRAYQRWLVTQNEGPAAADRDDGWLMGQRFLHHERAPGNTCLSALSAGQPGSVSLSVNNSKGCGGVMRVAPAGLAAADPFSAGCQAAAFTHGHPSGYLAAGAFALIIHRLVRGEDLPGAIAAAVDTLTHVSAPADTSEVIRSLESATQAAADGPAGGESIAALGAGWVAEEALAIAVYCALTATSFRSGVLAAINHGGDSDSTGAICGNILGAGLGIDAIDTDLLDRLEGRDVITQVADDLHAVFADGHTPDAERYPSG